MGLDMYLELVPKVDSMEELQEMETRLSKAYYKNKLESELKKIQKEKGFKNPISYKVSEWIPNKEKYEEYNKECHSPKISLRTEAGYWRKFNALHSWFVDKCQDGIDECQSSFVNEELLKELLYSLANLNKENADDILPTQSGFFFGGTEYDEYYFEQVDELKLFLFSLFEENDLEETRLVYTASW
jgi:hypothetical protein